VHHTATVGNGVEVRASTLPKAGRGLFACVPFVRGDLITEYAGPVVGVAEVKKRDLSACTHVGTLRRMFLYVDGLREATAGAGGGSFVNDPRFGRVAEYNAVLFVRYDCRAGRWRLFVKAVHDIGAGAEVFVSYGADWWRRFG
jgi:sensor domain CHASE-containing protein